MSPLWSQYDSSYGRYLNVGLNISDTGYIKMLPIGNLNFVRPAVILHSNVTLSTETDFIQDGTKDKPYIID